MPGRSNLGPNSVDTEQIYDGCVTMAKMNVADMATFSAAITAAIAASQKIVVKYISVNMATTGTVVTPICTIPSMSFVTDVFTVCEVASDGNGTINVGDADLATGYMINANITKTLNAVSGADYKTRGAYLYTPGAQDGTTPFAVQEYGHPIGRFYLAPVVANVTNVKGTNTVGTMGVYLIYKKVTPS
jgi:hypothetical protein